MNTDSVHLRVLGAVPVIELRSGEAAPRSIAVSLAEEHVVRGLAAHPQGLNPTDLTSSFRVVTDKLVHSSAHRLRTLLKDLGLGLSNARPGGYQIRHADGSGVALTSDLSSLSSAGELIARLQKEWRDDPEPPAVALHAALSDLDAIVAIWPDGAGARRLTFSQRTTVLGDLTDHSRHRLLIDLDTEVRLERAKRAVALAKLVSSASVLDSARRAIADLDASGDAYDRHRAPLLHDLKVLERELDSLVDAKTDVFLAAPMLAADDYEDSRLRAERISQALRDHCDVGTVFFAGSTIKDADHFEAPSVGLGRNMPFFRTARIFVMVYPAKVASGVLVEAGIALALQAPSVYFVKSRDDLPWVLQDVSGANDGELAPVHIIEYRDDNHLLELIEQHGNRLFPKERL